jgi:hypothetical protein
MADAFGAQVGVDFVDFFALGNRRIRALGFADVAVDAVVGDDQGHVRTTPADARQRSLDVYRKTVGELCRIAAAHARGLASAISA